MKSQSILFNLYKSFWDVREVLTQAPALTMDLSGKTVGNIDVLRAEAEVYSLVSYLLSVSDVRNVSVEDILKIIQHTYNSQPFWKDLLLNYVDFVNQKEAEEIQREGLRLRKQACDVLNEIRQEEYQRKMLVKVYADKIKKEKFPVDAERLMASYFTMYRHDSKKAWETLISNPGYFSPIITTDRNGHAVLTPIQAKEVNKKLAKFLKGLRV